MASLAPHDWVDSARARVIGICFIAQQMSLRHQSLSLPYRQASYPRDPPCPCCADLGACFVPVSRRCAFMRSRHCISRGHAQVDGTIAAVEKHNCATQTHFHWKEIRHRSVQTSRPTTPHYNVVLHTFHRQKSSLALA